MSLFLPILLLGFAQSADLPASSARPQPQTQSTESAFVNPPKFALPYTPSKNNVLASPNGQTVLNGQMVLHDPQTDERSLCFTMRTYLFQQRDGFAPEPVGMTTCQPASARKQKRVTGKARLVPAD